VAVKTSPAEGYTVHVLAQHVVDGHAIVLRLPDLDHCKLAVLNSLGSPASRRVYGYAIDQLLLGTVPHPASPSIAS